jgi:hypothetical protein
MFAAEPALETGGGAVFANARVYSCTVRADYAKAPFCAETTVTIKGGGGAGCAFFGLGKGEANPKKYGEPTTAPALYLRLAPSDFAGGVVTISANEEELEIPPSAIGDGTHRVRMTWHPNLKRALFEINRNWDGKAFKADISLAVATDKLNFGTDARLFVGGSGGVRFTDFAIRELSADELKKVPFGLVIASDPTAGTWLPVEGRPGSGIPETAELLKLFDGTLRPLACQYNGAKLAAGQPFSNGEVKSLDAQWSCSVKSTPVADADGKAIDLTLTFKLENGMVPAAGAAVAFDFTNWRTDNYVLIPSSVYNGNRNRIVGRGYNAGLDRKELYNKDLQITHGEVPALALEPGKSSKLEVSSCNTATPAICVYNRTTRCGFILLAEQAGRAANGDFLRKPNGEILDNVFAVEESPDRTRATIVVSAPGVRERKPEFIGFSGSPDRGIALKAGDSITLKLRAYSFKAASLPAFLDKFMAVRKAVTGKNIPRCLVPASQVETWMAQRIDSRFHNGKEHKFYCPENAAWISYGWIGGLMNTFPMLVLGDEKHLERATQTLDFGIKGQGKSGYYYGCIDANGKTFGREAYDDHQELVLTRKNGDLLYWLVKQFELLRAQGKGAAIKPEWEQSAKRIADAFATTWERDGQWGQYLNVEDGRVAIYNTSGGVIACGGLALASQYFGNPEYLKVAKQAAGFYYERDLAGLGFTSGACADIMQNADSETAAGLMTALMALYEVTGDGKWLEMSRNAANLAATWTVSYDYELPKFTELGGLGAKLTGVVWASTQNKHGAPGICTSSGDPLFKIYRATGDTRYADLMRDIIGAHGESIRPGGYTNERLTYCDADSRGSRGDHVTGWNETNGILMAQELPGIYLQIDTGRFYVFDAVEAKRDGNTLTITNPTKFDAAVTIFAESAAQAKKPLGYTAFLKWPRIEVKAGETKTVTIGQDGKR